MTTTEELIDTLSKGDMVQASNAFTDLMQSRVQNALDDRKVEIGQQMHLSPEEIEQMHAEEDEEELEEVDTEEDESEDDSEEAEEEEELEDDEDIQPVSTES
jgi:hypothetical protein